MRLLCERYPRALKMSRTTKMQVAKDKGVTKRPVERSLTIQGPIVIVPCNRHPLSISNSIRRILSSTLSVENFSRMRSANRGRANGLGLCVFTMQISMD